ncbi:MAG: 16S rRNA (guanine(527)-N(7))-methyltransferase RsmG [Candidatus Margulisiibacteriota bacterium]
MPNEEAFNTYQNELIVWNKKFNLTAITDPQEIQIKHFEDSLSIDKFVPISNQSIIDVGTGAGFPGIPIKLSHPDVKLTLLDATRKKTEFLKHIVALLQLQNTSVVWARAEEFAVKNREIFDIAVSRAVAKLNTLCEYCLPLVRVGGIFAAYKEENIEEQVKEAKPAITQLGGKIKGVYKYSLSNGTCHSLVIIKKRSPTPPQFPRPIGIAKTSPL